MPTSLGRRSVPALAVMLFVALVLIGCSSSDSNTTTSSVSVQSKSGTYDVAGTWIGCSANGSTYEQDIYMFSGSTLTLEFRYNLAAGCASPPAAADDTISTTVALDGTKDAFFSSDSSTADSSAPTGLTQPATATKLLVTVTATTTTSPAVGEQGQLLGYVDDSQTPPVYYRDAGNNGTDGYPDLLQTIDTLIKQ